MDLPLHPPSPVLRLLAAGIPPTLLLDLLDPEGMRAALAGELAALDAERAVTVPSRRTAATA